MKKMELKWRKLLRTIFGGLSLTAVAFVFQACYGPGGDGFYDVKLTGTVKSKTTSRPVKGIKVTVNNLNYIYGITDENGNFGFYASVPSWYRERDNDSVRYTPDSVYVHFTDMDTVADGHFTDKTIIIDPAHKDEVKINVELEEKQDMP